MFGLPKYLSTLINFESQSSVAKSFVHIGERIDPKPSNSLPNLNGNPATKAMNNDVHCPTA